MNKTNHYLNMFFILPFTALTLDVSANAAVIDSDHQRMVTSPAVSETSPVQTDEETQLGIAQDKNVDGMSRMKAVNELIKLKSSKALEAFGSINPTKTLMKKSEFTKLKSHFQAVEGDKEESLSIAKCLKVEATKRLEAAKKLEELQDPEGAKEAYLSIAQCLKVDVDQRFQSAQRLEELQDPEGAKEVYLSIAQCSEVEATKRVQSAKKLEGLKDLERAATAYLSIAQCNKNKNKNQKTNAITALILLANELVKGEKKINQEIYKAIFSEFNINICKYIDELDTFIILLNKFEAAQKLEELQDLERAVMAYLSIAECSSVGVDQRFQAANRLEVGELQDIERAVMAYLSIAQCSSVGVDQRFQAAQKLEELQDIEGAVMAYLSIAQCSCVDVSKRFEAAQKLEDLKDLKRAKEAYLSIAQCSNVDDDKRFEAQNALNKLFPEEFPKKIGNYILSPHFVTTVRKRGFAEDDILNALRNNKETLKNGRKGYIGKDGLFVVVDGETLITAYKLAETQRKDRTFD